MLFTKVEQRKNGKKQSRRYNQIMKKNLRKNISALDHNNKSHGSYKY